MFTTCLSAQDTSTFLIVKDIDTAAFDSLSEFTKYPETKRILQLRKKYLDKPEVKKIERKSVPGLEYIIIALVVILCIFLIAIFFSANNKDKKISTKALDLNNIEDIHEVDSDQLFKEAIANGDLRLAIRLQFIKSLQSLSHNNLIDWQMNKTNRDYYNEINERTVRNDFKDLVFIYDNVWYGNKDINQTIFDIYTQKFETFINKLNV